MALHILYLAALSTTTNVGNRHTVIGGKMVEFFPARAGLDAKRIFKIIGPASQTGDVGYNLTFNIPTHGHSVADVIGN